ncbi:hypothetical protein GGR57DRAFT_497946 [Xylariaceae sp. FL1272]|nr:hypothetical protein GGR57DRAFT_497946 [Xylariaceae sp. FL1272]
MPAYSKSPVKSNLVDFAQLFAGKIQKGLQKVQNPSQRIHRSTADLGAELSKRRQDVKDEGTESLEAYLNEVGRNTPDTAWLATFYARYLGYQRRSLDPAHSQSGDLYVEQSIKGKEKICMVMAQVVDRLYPYWGVCSSLVFNALRETRFKASRLEKATKKELGAVVDLIVGLFLQMDINLTISKTTPIINPAFFLGLFLDQPYSEICKDIGLERYSDLDLQKEIDASTGRLGQLGLECGQFSLSTLIEKSGATAESDENSFVIRLSAVHQSFQVDQQQHGKNIGPPGGINWMEFINIQEEGLVGEDVPTLFLSSS